MKQLAGKPLIEAVVDSLCERWPLAGAARTAIVTNASAAMPDRKRAADIIVAGFKAEQ